VVATITFQRAAPAASGPGPSVIQPCAVKPGAASADDTCDSGIITCTVSAHEPSDLYFPGEIDFDSFTYCSDEVPQIRMGQDVIHSTPIDPNNPLTNSTVKNDTSQPATRHPDVIICGG
jgi:hypothetical protein